MVLRYIPFVGPWLAALPPLTVAVVVSPGWAEPLLAAGALSHPGVCQQHLYRAVGLRQQHRRLLAGHPPLGHRVERHVGAGRADPGHADDRLPRGAGALRAPAQPLLRAAGRSARAAARERGSTIACSRWMSWTPTEEVATFQGEGALHATCSTAPAAADGPDGGAGSARWASCRARAKSLSTPTCAALSRMRQPCPSRSSPSRRPTPPGAAAACRRTSIVCLPASDAGDRLGCADAGAISWRSISSTP